MLPHIVKYNFLRIVTLVVAFCLLHTIVKAQSTVYVATLTELTTALSTAQNGTVIQIGPGTIGPVTATYSISTGVTIRGSVNPDGTPATTLTTTSARIFNVTTPASAGVVNVENLIVTALPGQGGPGPGFIYATGANTRVVIDNVVASGFNVTQGSGQGGVLRLEAGAYVIVRNSIFRNNQGRNGGVFGAAGATTRLEVESSRMYNNYATNNGGVFHVNAATVIVSNSHIYDNTLPPGSQGGAAYIEYGGVMTVFRTYLVGNTITHGGAAFQLGRGCNTLNLFYVSIVGNNNYGNAAGAIGAASCDTVNIKNALITGNLTTGGNFGNDLTPGPGINIDIENSIVGEDFFVNNDSVFSGVVGPGDVVVGDDGHVFVNLKDYLIDKDGNIIEIPYPRDDYGNIDIGAGGSGGRSQIIPISIILTVSDSIPCVDMPVTFMVEMRNIQHVNLATQNIEYQLYLMVGSSREVLESETTNIITGTTFTISRPNVAFERIRVSATYIINVVDIMGNVTQEQRTQISNEQILMIVPPLAAGKIEHSRNTP